MELSEVKVGVRVVYARGSKEPLIGKQGVIASEHDPVEGGIVMVNFDYGGISPCYFGNLDVISF